VGSALCTSSRPRKRRSPPSSTPLHPFPKRHSPVRLPHALAGAAILLFAPPAHSHRINSVTFGAASVATPPTAEWGRDIVIAGPVSLLDDSPHYHYGRQLVQAASFFASWLNLERGGILLHGRRHAVRLHFLDDGGSVEQTANATSYALGALGADFILSGYSAPLAMAASLVCKQHGKLMLSAGTNSPEVFQAHELSFGVAGYLPSVVRELLDTIIAAAEAVDRREAAVAPPGENSTVIQTEAVHVEVDAVLPPSACDGRGDASALCRASLKLGFVRESGDVGLAGFCDSFAYEAAAKGVGATEGAFPTAVVQPDADDASVEQVLAGIRAAGANVLVLCLNFGSFSTVIRALQRIDWTPLATLAGGGVMNSPEFAESLARGWWQGEYAIGTTGWHWKLPGTGAFSGMSASTFRDSMYNRFFLAPNEQAAGQFAQCLMLVAAIEAAQSLSSDAVAAAMARLHVDDILGNLSYRADYRLNAAPGMALQHPQGGEPSIVHPAKLRTGPIHFPSPSWKTRACRWPTPECSAHGYCSVDGVCVCDAADGGYWAGGACEKWVARMSAWVFLAPLITALIAGLPLSAVALYVRRARLRERDEQRVHQTLANITQPRFPGVFVYYRTFKKIGKFVAHERLRDMGKTVTLDSHDELVQASVRSPMVFVSHQWLGFEEPDPKNDHYTATVEACELLCAQENLDPSSLLIWLDYMSIPQKNAHTQQLAIDSLGIYASCCRYFIIIAPEVVHADSLVECSPETYSRRGWCRLEQWARLTAGREGMFLFGGDRTLQLLTSSEMDRWFHESVHVFEGDFTVPSDKDRISDTVLGLWAIAVLERRKSGSAFLYDIVDQQRARVFPHKHFPRNQQDLIEEHLAYDHVGKELKQQVVQRRSHSRSRSRTFTLRRIPVDLHRSSELEHPQSLCHKLQRRSPSHLRREAQQAHEMNTPEHGVEPHPQSVGAEATRIFQTDSPELGQGGRTLNPERSTSWRGRARHAQ